MTITPQMLAFLFLAVIVVGIYMIVSAMPEREDAKFTCPLCGEDHAVYVVRDGLRVLQCDHCGEL